MARAHRRGPRFPTLGVILLVVGLLWMFEELGWVAVDIPWIPIVLIIVASGMVINGIIRR